MVKDRITSAIRDFLDNDCGFDAFVMMHGDQLIRKLNFYEGNPQRGTDNFKAEVFSNIKRTIESKFLAPEAEYCMAEQLAGNRKKFYAIRHNEDYHPFYVITIPEDQIQPFSVREYGDAQGFLFRLSIGGSKMLWAYQHIWPVTIPNKKKQNLLLKAFSPDREDVFVKFKDTIFTITHKVDLLIVTSVLGKMSWVQESL